MRQSPGRRRRQGVPSRLKSGKRGDAEQMPALPWRTRDVVLEFTIYFSPAFKKINGTVLAVFVGARRDASKILRNRRFHRPDEGMNRTENEDRGLLIPAGFAQRLSPIFRGVRFERPRRIGAKLCRDSERTQERPRFHVSRDDQRILDVALAQGLNESVHVARFAPVGERKLVFGGGQSQRTDHHS